MRQSSPRPGTIDLNRRDWLAATIAGAFTLRARADVEGRGEEGTPEARLIAELRDQVRKLGLADFEVGRTEHYLGIGNAPETFREAALEICEGLVKDFLQHFTGKGFDLKHPRSRLVVVILANPTDFARFLEIESVGPVRGIYDLDANHLVICDNREPNHPLAERANTVALCHEATHQLSFNTGLLDRLGDVPLCISEGLAMYGEVRRPRGQTRIGALNRERLAVLAESARQGQRLFPMSDLITQDDLLVATETRQLANAQSWLLTYQILRDPEILPRFRRYLDAIRGRRSDEHRLQDAREHLGDLDRLDQTLIRAANRLLKA